MRSEVSVANHSYHGNYYQRFDFILFASLIMTQYRNENYTLVCWSKLNSDKLERAK